MNPCFEMFVAAMLIVPLIGLSLSAEGRESAAKGNNPSGTLELPPLPYAQEALEPYISARTISFHYGKHHQTYVDNLNKLISGTPLQGKNLLEIVKQSVGVADEVSIFNNAAQVWNHNIFWRSMMANGGGNPPGRLGTMIQESFGSLEQFKNVFTETALAQFGSGYVWLVQDGDSLKVVKTGNADNPMAHGTNVLMTCDLWEHAYYLDYQNKRKDFVQAFLNNLVNWQFAASNLK